MAIFGPFLNAAILFNGVDLSDHIAEVSVEIGNDEVDLTAMGDGGHKRRTSLQSSSFSVKFWQDFASNKVDQLVYAAMTGGTEFPVKIWPNGTTSGTQNPYFSANCIGGNYTPLSGAVGAALDAPVTLPVSGTVTRGTS